MRGRRPLRSRFVAVSTVSTSSRPSPATSPGGPSTPSGSRDHPAQHLVAAAKAEHPAAAPAWARMSMSQPSARSAARSPMVDLEPGRMTRSASAGSGWPRLQQRQRHAGLQRQRIEVVVIGDARQQRHGDLDAAPLPAVARAACKILRILRRQPVDVGEPRHDAECRPAGPFGDDPRCPRRTAPGRRGSWLIRNPRISARSASGSTAWVPTRLAMTPPRSMSPTSTTGTPRRRRKAHVGDVAGAQVDFGRHCRRLRPARDRPPPPGGRRRRRRPAAGSAAA